jgi:ribosomal protein S18 acetylase RimI-like enzyme
VSDKAVAPRIRGARAEDAGRIGEIARAAYGKYVPRIGRAPAPMAADFAAQIAAGRVVVIEADGTVAGYMVAWPQADAYFIDNIAVDPARQGGGFGRRLIDHGEREARRHALGFIRLYTNAAMTENLAYYPQHGYTETHRAQQDGFHRVFFRKRVDT